MNVFEITHRTVETFFKRAWLVAMPSTPITFGNAPFAQPAGEWVRLTVRFGTGVQASIGSHPLEKMPGVVFIQIFTPKNVGERRAKVLADAASTILRYVQLKDGGVVIDFGAPAVPGEQEATTHMQSTLSVAFVAQHIT